MKQPAGLGQSAPLGATLIDGGLNFSVFSRTASAVELLLFDREDDARAARVIRLDPATNRTYEYTESPATGRITSPLISSVSRVRAGPSE